MNHTEQLQEKIAVYRAECSARRARAFVDCRDAVLGLPVEPITPASWTMLQAVGTRLLGGETPMEGDVRNYLWFHSRLFRAAVYAPALTGLFKWFALLRFNAILHKQKDIDWYAATIALAVNDIRGLMVEALADAPRGDRACAPGPCLEAQLIHYCASNYGWAAEYTRGVPLRKLMQLIRSAGTTDDDDPAEREIRFAHLRERNAELEAARAHEPATPATD